jgi:hypothetical protein
MGEQRTTAKGYFGNSTQRVLILCLLVVLNASADYIVDLGAARDFLFLDVSPEANVRMEISKGFYEGRTGLAGGINSQFDLRATLSGDIYRTADSLLKIKRKGGEHIGLDYAGSDMTAFVEAVDTAVAQFGLLNQDLDLGAVDQLGGLTLNRTDAYTVVDMSSLKLSSGSLTINGEADDIFYIRVRDMFELSSVDVVVNGTDASRVFFIYEGTNDLFFGEGALRGNLVAPNAAVLLTAVQGFEGSVISGGGLRVRGSGQGITFQHTAAIPESTVFGLIAVAGGGAILIHRFFKVRQVAASRT